MHATCVLLRQPFSPHFNSRFRHATFITQAQPSLNFESNIIVANPKILPITPPIMSDPETPSTSLGKRLRHGSRSASPTIPEMPPADVEDSSDEEIGPMPIPSSSDNAPTNGHGRKKKRATLPHERLYLDHLPDTDRYYKSFMHRDAVKHVVVTKWVVSSPLVLLRLQLKENYG